MTGVASTATRPLPIRGAVCSGPTSRSADPFIPIFKCDRSIIDNCQWGDPRRCRGEGYIVPDAVWEFNRCAWSRCRPDERQSRFRVFDLAQVRRTFGNDDFKGRANMSFAQVPRHCGPIAHADDPMKMECRLA